MRGKSPIDLRDTPEETRVGVLLVTRIPDAAGEEEALKGLEELRLLCETALEGESDTIVFRLLTQQKHSPESATYIGSGKAQEAAKLCADEDLSLVVFDVELTPSQIKNLEEIITSYDAKNEKVRVIDRTMLILDIFAKHATTGEGKLQVEIAQLRYTVPRLVGKGTALSRQGGTSGAVGARGPGETKLETDRRHVRRRIEALEAQLRDLETVRRTKRAKHAGGMCRVAVAGYTNAGKSTLLNILTGAGILAENKLFATLDPTTRLLSLPSGREVLLTDTVGFIKNLPHRLVEAFKSTLDEVCYADVILIVADASDGETEEKIDVTRALLRDLGAAQTPQVLVYNKCDGLDILPLAGDRERLRENGAVCISARTGAGIDDLLSLLEETVSRLLHRVTFLFPFDKQSAVDALFRQATVLETEYVPEGTRVTALADEKLCGKYRAFMESE